MFRRVLTKRQLGGKINTNKICENNHYLHDTRVICDGTCGEDCIRIGYAPLFKGGKCRFCGKVDWKTYMSS